MPINHGAISRTFLGDGGYNIFVQKNSQNEVVAAMVQYDCSEMINNLEPNLHTKPTY